MQVTTTDRYTQVSESAKIADISRLNKVVAAGLVEGLSDSYGEATLAVQWESDYESRLVIKALDELGEDAPNWLLGLTYDQLISDILWDKRRGEPSPSIYWIDLGGRDRGYWEQFLDRGPLTRLVSSGWAKFYFSGQACHKTAKSIERFFGPEWSVSKSLISNDRGIPTTLMVLAKHRQIVDLAIAFKLVGQGQIREVPPVLAAMTNGVEFFTVHDCQGRSGRGCQRLGSNVRGHAWQW